MRVEIRRLTVVLVLVVVGAACGGEGDTAVSDADVDGEALFAERVLEGRPGCITCHSLEPGSVLVGPSLSGLGARAGSTVAGVSAEDYLRESIVDPDAYVVDGYSAGKMPSYWSDVLTDAQIGALVSYLVALP